MLFIGTTQTHIAAARHTQALSRPSGSSTTFSTGSLSATGNASRKPSVGSSSYVDDTLVGRLICPSGSDFELYPQKLSGSTWSDVAASDGSTSTEKISCGTYLWQVYSYNGTGPFSLTETE